MRIELTQKEIKTVAFYLEKSLIDAEGLCAIGFGNPESVQNIKSVLQKLSEKTITPEEPSAQNRLNKLKSFKDNAEFIKQDKERKIQAETEILVAKIKDLRPRIAEILETGNACLQAGIPLTVNDTFRHDLYADGQFRACDIYHSVGFVLPYRDKEKSVELLGHNEGGKDSYFFRTDGIQVYSVHNQKKCEPLVEDMKRFLNQFDEFESRFYAYVDKMLEKQEKSINDIKAEDKNTSLNDKIVDAAERADKFNSKLNMTRYEMEQKVKEYVTSDIHNLEDYSDIEICCEADREDALRLMDTRVENSTDAELEAFCKAIDTHTVDYMTHGCR